jgi:1-deoxy-D-xylulose-5-phosphate synthase
MADHHYSAEVRRLGIPDWIVEHGEQLELHHESGFDVQGIEKAVLAMHEPVSK